MKKQFLQSAKIIILGLVIGLGVSMISAWTGAPGTPPGGNTPAPINTGLSAQSKGGFVPSGALFDVSGLFTSDRLLVAGDATVGDLSDTANPSTTYPAHVCANANGTLEICGATAPVSGQQIYSLSGGTQVSSGDCTLCNGSTFITPTGVTSVNVTLIGGGGGGGGSYHYSSKINTIPACNNAVGCEIGITGSGGGGAGASTFTVNTQASLVYSVTVGRGGAGGASADGGDQNGNPNATGQATDGAAGTSSSFSGSFGGVLVNATASGGGAGSAGRGGNGYHLPGTPPAGGAGTAGYGNAITGLIGKIGYVVAFNSDTGTTFQTSYQAGVTTSVGGTNSATGTNGDGGNGSTSIMGSGAGANGQNGVVVVSWTI